MKLRIHLVDLPRWFGAPAIIAASVLGSLLAHAPLLPMLLATLSGLFLMCYSHSANTFLDFYWTKLDQGETGERSNPKPYTSGQQLLASGAITKGENIGNMIFWVILSAIPLIWLPRIAIIPWALILPMTFWYSWAKLHWHPELPLGLGFGTFSVWLGFSASGNIDWIRGGLASLPLFWAFGVLAEHADQARDFRENWPKGARSWGMASARAGTMGFTLVLILALTYVSQAIVVNVGILARESLLSLTALPLALVAIVKLHKAITTTGLILGLGAIFLFEVLMVVGQAIGGRL